MKRLKLCKGVISCIALMSIFISGGLALASEPDAAQDLNPNPPSSTVKLIFLHHSTGQNWLNDSNGGLGIALKNNNYFVSDTNYNWGIGSIGSYTDIGNYWTWFRGPDSASIMAEVYAESGQNSSYTRLANDPGGANQVIMFKSCFPNSALKGSPSDPIPPIDSNLLRGQDANSPYHTISNVKGIYIDLLNYFKLHPDKLFILITAPPLSDATYSTNARLLNEWLVNEWLKNYPLNNVAVFDFYNVLTTNGGDANTNDLGSLTGNHHRYLSGAIQHITNGDNDSNGNILEYPSSVNDDHPSQAGNLKATAEFLPLLNIFYNRWQSGNTQPPVPTPDPNKLRIFLPVTIKNY